MSISGIEIRKKRQEIGLSQAKLAELAKVPQHLLSAYELEKSFLDNANLSALEAVLSAVNDDKIQSIKKKRFRIHSFNNISKDFSRISKYKPTEENGLYTSHLDNLEQLREKHHKVGNVLTLFSGCGGFSLGFEWADFNVLGFVELKEGFRKIYRRNFPQAVELGADIQKISDEEILIWKKRFGEIDVITGGPPCQGFSLSGKRDTNDPRNDLFKSYMKIVQKIRPKVAVMENVRLLTSMKTTDGSSVLSQIYKEFDEVGYDVEHFEINAKDYGIPQHRERIIFIATEKNLNIKPTIPPPTHGNIQTLLSPLCAPRTFADACSDLDFLESGEKSSTDSLHEAVKHPDHIIEWLWNVPQGKSAHNNEDPELRPPSGYNTTYKRQIWNEPASTVQTTFGMISGCRNVHPIATRSLTIREAARIQSFPDSFKFSGSLGDIRATIGNAVPPLLAYAIAKHIKTEILNLVEISGF